MISLSFGQEKNFQTLRRAMLACDAALMECQLAVIGEPVAEICAANRISDESVAFVLFAMLFPDDPYRALNPRKPDDGFYCQEEVFHG